MVHLNVTVAGLLYIASCTIGLYHSLRILPAYLFAYRSARKVANPEDRVRSMGYALEYLVSEGLRFSVHLFSAIIGYWSLLVVPIPPPLHLSLNNVLFTFSILTLLVWANTALTLNTIFKRYSFERRSGTSSWTSRHIEMLLSRVSLRRHPHRKKDHTQT